MAGDLWTDLRLVFTVIFFIYLVKWGVDLTKSKTLGIVLASIVSYFTFYSHFELVAIIVVLFFGYPFFSALADAMGGKK